MLTIDLSRLPGSCNFYRAVKSLRNFNLEVKSGYILLEFIQCALYKRKNCNLNSKVRVSLLIN